MAPTSLFLIPFGAIFGAIGVTVGTSLIASDLGAAFVAVPLTLIFGGIGGGMVLFSLRHVAAMKATYRNGEVAPGVVTNVALDPTVKVNGRSPFAIHYQFEAADGERTGRTRTWVVPRDMFPGRPVHIIYDRDKPKRNLLYPLPGRD